MTASAREPGNPPPGKNIVICLDGTGNQVGTRNHHTNVVKLFEMLDLSDPARQIGYYDAGVGTMSAANARGFLGRWWSRMSGLAFGSGLRTNVAEAYTYLMQHWQPGDRIYIFGFSRGAYTSRALAGMLNKPGLMRAGSENLVPYALSMYATNEEDINKVQQKLAAFTEAFCRHTSDHPLWATVKQNQPSQVSSYAVPVSYLGIWDTVKAAGFLRVGRLRWLYTRTLPNVDRIRHAISINEHRRPYREYPVHPLEGRTTHNPNSLEQAWFAGVHSDVGGTFDHKEGEGLLSTIALKWVADAIVDELRLKPAAYSAACTVSAQCAEGTIHKMGWIWTLLGTRHRPLSPDARIHASVKIARRKRPAQLAGVHLADDDPRWVDDDWLTPRRDLG